MFKGPKMPAPPPPPPTVDQAANAQEMERRVGRRRGRLATMFAGARGSTGVSTVTRQALGI